MNDKKALDRYSRFFKNTQQWKIRRELPYRDKEHLQEILQLTLFLTVKY